ncbi:aminotransferase class I/II-fold pyridoxal phosphate-dependent enzyme [Bacillus sp. JCM 19041]|uniref:aminotransferase class I/II-fold pyridoxal phosphate-dependent enzyme n=1 Tax=Bacillus sp. JCM 19041 TaxID=1460637 RepID=UPI0006D0F531
MKRQTPIIEALQLHTDKNPFSFHVPGHKNGEVWPDSLKAFEKILLFDQTELEGLDDLHDPEGAIAESQALCASYYGSKETSYLVGGSTSGNLAMVYGICDEDDLVFVQRNSHKSIINGLELARTKAVFLDPIYDPYTNHPVGITVDILEEALLQYPRAKALILTYPNYWGVALDQCGVIAHAKAAGLYVLVDEAHGAHFRLGEADCSTPPSALSLGADVVVQSTHKMLPALTMGAWMHFSEKIQEEGKAQIKRALAMIQSSSPSYLLLASLDAAQDFLRVDGARAYKEALKSRDLFVEWLKNHQLIEVIENEDGLYQKDPLKVTIRTKDDRTGGWLLSRLREAGIWAEMADDHSVLLVLGLGDTVTTMYKRFEKLDWQRHKKDRFFSTKEGVAQPVSELIDMKKMNHASECVPLEAAVGRKAASAIVPYPPGVPLLIEGERVTPEHIQQIKCLLQNNSKFQGQQPDKGLRVQMPGDET